VILLDTNLLLYATISAYPQHVRSRDWFAAQLGGTSRVALSWHSLLGYVCIASHRGVFKNGPSVDDAWNEVRRWLALDHVWIPSATERHADVISDLLATSKVRSQDVMDIHLAALAIEHGLTLCSADDDFARYRGLRVLNPLIP
jgi:toxin-antitoxin system PIN domain toxin